MMRNTPAWLIPVTLLFGVLIGVVSVFALGTGSGVVTLNSAAAEPEGQSATPGTDRLNNFSCRKGETKSVLIGGVEDNYSTETLEPTNMAREDIEQLNKGGRRRAFTHNRIYDEGGVDRHLVEKFPLPDDVADGLFVIKFRSTVTFENDRLRLTMSHLSKPRRLGVTFPLTDLEKHSNMEIAGDIHFARFSEISRQTELLSPDEFRENLQLIEYINDYPPGSMLDINIGDDIQVDFMGIAICERPAEKMGMTHLINAFSDESIVLPFPEPATVEWISLSCDNAERVGICDPHIGDTPCDIEIPLTCFSEEYAPVPDSLPDGSFYNWSGGRVKFTAPIAGNAFENQDDAHQYCRAEFGDDWRVANLGEGSSGDIIYAYGEAPDAEKAWIDSTTQIYGNCWALRPDYDEAPRDE